MAQTVRKYFVLPTPEELAASSGPITITLTSFTDINLAKAAAVKEAIVTGKERIIVESSWWADPTLALASVTAQINAIP
jgi:hypothetical protein